MSDNTVDNALDASTVLGFYEGTGGNPEPVLVAAARATPAIAVRSEERQYGEPIDSLDEIGIYRTVSAPPTTDYGYKWECVEFVNRYYAAKMGIANMVGHARSYMNRSAYGMVTFRSDVAREAPQHGDILVTDEGRALCNGSPCGHVAIAGQVIIDDANGTASVEVKQQNLSPSTFTTQFRRNSQGVWSAGEFSRGFRIKAWVRKSGSISLDQPAPQEST